MQHQKLVRDLIPQLIEDGGNEAITRILEQEEYIQALKDKLKEEVHEYLETEDPEDKTCPRCCGVNCKVAK